MIDDQFWFGVLMPSVDRVGRYFPLTIAAPFAVPSSLPPLDALEQWFEGLALAALSTLPEGATVDDLEARLARLPSPARVARNVAPPAAGDGPVFVRVSAPDGLQQAFGDLAATTLRRQMAGASLWWPRTEHDPATSISLCRGLPPARLFARLLSGSL